MFSGQYQSIEIVANRNQMQQMQQQQQSQMSGDTIGVTSANMFNTTNFLGDIKYLQNKCTGVTVGTGA